MIRNTKNEKISKLLECNRYGALDDDTMEILIIRTKMLEDEICFFEDELHFLKEFIWMKKLNKELKKYRSTITEKWVKI